ncbi:hypothetical protein [Halalkalicoccus sp. NIPERK01]|uniref:hypothetical protein n=1 Tax=Halalkalicoccus sp. NIPERK01 TaxID=3053469 RepID=UPI00256EEDC9|nr:hypothetical protein [Halalkalicoccus sp. NIPERK01]MDL5362582.1 hypothetical protein [Halalkalicoccus sp. NIPERK01]
METECTYCGSDIERHDPVFVNEGTNTSDSQAGQFCNYACLTAYVEEEGLATGAACEWP